MAENNSNQNKPGSRNSGPGNRGNRGGPPTSYDAEGRELVEKIVFINRSSKVVKGGRRFSFSALVDAGDKNGRVGLGLGKASEVADCIRKGSDLAKRQMVPISLSGNTIPHEIVCIYDGARVILRPASPGTGIIAGKTVRAVVESAGIRDLLTKSLGSKNPANVAKATIDGLSKLRLREEVYALRGLKVRKKDEASEPAAAATATEASATETAATGNE